MLIEPPNGKALRLSGVFLLGRPVGQESVVESALFLLGQPMGEKSVVEPALFLFFRAFRGPSKRGA